MIASKDTLEPKSSDYVMPNSQRVYRGLRVRARGRRSGVGDVGRGGRRLSWHSSSASGGDRRSSAEPRSRPLSSSLPPTTATASQLDRVGGRARRARLTDGLVAASGGTCRSARRSTPMRRPSYGWRPPPRPRLRRPAGPRRRHGGQPGRVSACASPRFARTASLAVPCCGAASSWSIKTQPLRTRAGFFPSDLVAIGAGCCTGSEPGRDPTRSSLP